jgi:hypothetical protein
MNYGEVGVAMFGAQLMRLLGIPWLVPLAVIVAVAVIVLLLRPEKARGTWREQIKANIKASGERSMAEWAAKSKRCPDGRDPTVCGACNNLPDYEHEHRDKG